MSNAVPVAVTGFTWTTFFVGLLNLLVGGVLVALIKTRAALKKIANEREANLLKERATDMEGMRKRIVKLEAERALDRYRINNLTQYLDALLMMIELDPEKARDAAAKVKAMREVQLNAEAAEKGAVHAAVIEAEKDTAE